VASVGREPAVVPVVICAGGVIICGAAKKGAVMTLLVCRVDDTPATGKVICRVGKAPMPTTVSLVLARRVHEVEPLFLAHFSVGLVVHLKFGRDEE